MANFTISSEIAAPVETVFDVLTDHRGYAKITPLRSSTLEREGSPDPNSVGAVRVHLESRLHAEAAAARRHLGGPGQAGHQPAAQGCGQGVRASG